jgi:hypothetical protein
MEFFAQPDEWPGKGSFENCFVLPPASELGGKTLTTLTNMVQRDVPMPRWGINE